MSKFLFAVLVVGPIGLTACISNPYSQVQNLRFQNATLSNDQLIRVQRDDKLCAEDTLEKQGCPINFYIDNILAGNFYVNNTAKYQLKSESYNFKVKNCTEASCQSCDVDLAIGQLSSNEFVLSVDNVGKPFILNNGTPLVCKTPAKAAKSITEKTLTLDLAADTLFKFNGSSLNDLLPKGRQEVLNVASQILNNFVSVNQIKLTGYTDRLGSDSYNLQLGQNRANTVRNLLVQNGVAGNIISAESAGKQQPITNGCFDVKQREELKTCLQPDRRVSVEITGITK
ncbi:OmpA family protein [Acinetobacter sp. SA01]|uniref:OmpA family protein n=1 Tax=Acinetobacter sp. SA01 TaxID=1862567 RepID=UPI0014072241|nr:OmpA family protein [Acinetobacter sp. SA01]